MTMGQLGRYLQQQQLNLAIRADSDAFIATLYAAKGSWVARRKDLDDAILSVMERRGAELGSEALT